MGHALVEDRLSLHAVVRISANSPGHRRSACRITERPGYILPLSGNVPEVWKGILTWWKWNPSDRPVLRRNHFTRQQNNTINTSLSAPKHVTCDGNRHPRHAPRLKAAWLVAMICLGLDEPCSWCPLVGAEGGSCGEHGPRKILIARQVGVHSRRPGCHSNERPGHWVTRQGTTWASSNQPG